MSLTDDLTRSLEANLGAVAPPPGDPDGAMRRGRGIRRRRTTLRTGGVVAAVVVVALGGTFLARPGAEEVPQPAAPFRLSPPLDLEGGLRAVASPDVELWLGGQRLDAGAMDELDLAAAATPYGLVSFDGGRAQLLGPDGVVVPLTEPVEDVPESFLPSAQADAALPLVALTRPGPDGVHVLLRDMEVGEVVADRVVPCSSGDCADIRVDGLDQGVVFVRTPDGPFVWDATATGSWTRFGPVGSRVVDARGGRVLWTDVPPEPDPDGPVADWPTTEGPVDSFLSHDGRHLLYWSAVLEPTTPDGRPITLDVRDATFFAFDTDGSVLTATIDGRVSDCLLPSGHCEDLGRLPAGSGDPLFPGSDA